MTFEHRKRGFTLIELLIVIAIILILIAIALPNFLDAQLRAKVTKAEAELMTVSQAVEVYRTDWPRYPPDACNEATRFSPFFPIGPLLRYSLMQLTTPTRYLLEIPLDIFRPSQGETLYDGVGYPLYFADTDLSEGFPYMYYSARSSRECPGSAIFGEMMEQSGFHFLVTSLGPDRDYDFGWLDPVVFVRGKYEAWSYVPTNGTKSSGDLYRKKR